MGRRGGRDDPQLLTAKILPRILTHQAPQRGDPSTLLHRQGQDVQPTRARASEQESSWWGGKGESWLAQSPTHSNGVGAQDALHAARAILDAQGLVQVPEGGGFGRVEAVVVFWNTDPG